MLSKFIYNMKSYFPMNEPLVSIGVPTYNRAEDLRACLTNLTGLAYRNIEIIISDNHSTDSTSKVCKSFIKKDKRIHYYKQPSTVPGEKNFAYVLQKAKGKYFFIAADDDIRARTYITDLIPLLENYPEATTAITDTKLFSKNRSISIPILFRSISTPTASFYTYLLHPECVSVLLYGMHRRTQQFTENFLRIMNESRPFRIQGYDDSLAVFLLLQGPLLYLHKNLFSIRDTGMYLSVYQSIADIKLSTELFKKAGRYLLFPMMFFYDWYYGILHVWRSSVSPLLKPIFYISLAFKLIRDDIFFLFYICKAAVIFIFGLFRKINNPHP